MTPELLEIPARNTTLPNGPLKVLLENIHPTAAEAFRRVGFDVETVKGALDEQELIERIRDINVLGIRSKTEITRKVLEHTDNLLCIGAF